MTNPKEDDYAWTQETAEKLRRGRLNEVNAEDLIEEIEDRGASVWRALDSPLTFLLAHLLKRLMNFRLSGRGLLSRYLMRSFILTENLDH